jgi:hypothetical protein
VKKLLNQGMGNLSMNEKVEIIHGNWAYHANKVFFFQRIWKYSCGRHLYVLGEGMMGLIPGSFSGLSIAYTLLRTIRLCCLWSSKFASPSIRKLKDLLVIND